MPFKYRLQKVLELREQRLEDAKTAFQKASSAVIEVEKKIKKNERDILEIRKRLASGKTEGSPAIYINRLKYLQNKAEKLEQELERAKNKLEEAKQKMVKAQQDKEILERHKQKEKKKYQDEEDRKEQIDLNERGLIMRRIRLEREKEYDEPDRK